MSAYREPLEPYVVEEKPQQPYVTPTIVQKGTARTGKSLDEEVHDIFLALYDKDRPEHSMKMVQAVVKGRLHEMSESAKGFFDLMFGEQWREGAAA